MAQSPQQLDANLMRFAATPSAEGLERSRSRLAFGAALAGLGLYGALLAAAWWAAMRLLPDQMTLRLAGHAVVLQSIHARITGDGMLVFGLLPLALWIECAFAGWRVSSLRKMIFNRTASTKTDLALFVLGQTHVFNLLGRVMLLGASMVSGAWIYHALHVSFGYSIPSELLPLPAQVLVYFFVYTFFDYWSHRVDHSRYFWPLHRFHHSADEFCVLTAGREHPAAFTSTFLINLPLAVLGAPPEAMLYVNVVVISVGFLIHSRIDSDWGWVGRWIIQSPNLHRLHHKLDMSYPTGHFSMAPIWDRLFGTWGGQADQTLLIGVDAPYRHGFWVGADMARDYRDFWMGFFRRYPKHY